MKMYIIYNNNEIVKYNHVKDQVLPTALMQFFYFLNYLHEIEFEHDVKYLQLAEIIFLKP